MAKRPIKPEDLLTLQFVGDPQISPDGSRILYQHKSINDKNKYITNLFTVDVDRNIKQWTQGDGGAGHGRWSPDGKSIAFVSGRDKERKGQIWLIPTDGGEAKRLSSLPEGSLGGFKWSPDGKWIAFTFREVDPNWTEAALKERKENGLSTPPREIDDIWYRLDDDGYFLGMRHAVYLLEVSTGEHRKLYDADVMGFYSFDWSPNSKELAICHSANKRPMVEPSNDQIWRVDLEGQAWKLEGLPKGDKQAVSWSPDGKWLAYLGVVDELDPWGVRNNRLWLVSAKGGKAKSLTDKDDYCLTVASLSDTKSFGGDALVAWSPDSKAIYVSVGWHGETQLGFVELDKPGQTQLLTKGHHAIGVGNLSKSGERFACVFGDATRPNEVGIYDLSKDKNVPRTLTSLNKTWLEELKIAEPEEVWLDSTDGIKVQAWVMHPVEPKSKRMNRHPAVLQIHGGPHAQYGWAFFHEFQVLAAEGYVVVFSNPRGSKGYGEDFCAAIRGDWGNKDWEDIQTVTRWMQHQPFIHPGRLGVMGGSYGGYMTNWVIGHTHDFKAAITDRCVSNLVSMGGSSDFVSREDSYWKGCFYGDIEKLWKDSPIAYFKGVKTPTLIIHSEGDLRCNVEQGEQVFSALQAQGVESRFVRYPPETFHGLSRSGPPDLRLHRLGEILKWWGKHLG